MNPNNDVEIALEQDLKLQHGALQFDRQSRVQKKSFYKHWLMIVTILIVLIVIGLWIGCKSHD